MTMRTLIPTALIMIALGAGPLKADPDPGCEPTEASGCGGCLCEDCVCAMDPFCCTSEWDPMCVVRCVDQCGGCGAAASCGDGVCGPGEGCDACAFDCGQCPTPCGDISVKGCCLDGNLLACADGSLKISSCDGVCGWSLDASSYVCGGAGPDPAGVFPIECPAPPTEEDVVTEWPEVCEGVEWQGCCKDTGLFWCDGVGLQHLECGSNPPPLNTCGWVGGDDGHYDCGGGGADPTGAWDPECEEGLGEVIGPPPEDECTVGEKIQVGCGDVSFSGCCTDGQDLVFCEGGELLCTLHCAQLPSPLNTCGWKQAGETGFYDCGGDGIDPSGQAPIFCPDWTPVDDTISDGGSDTSTSTTCPGIPDGGCCEGTVLRYCEDGSEAQFDCAEMSSDPVFGAYVHCGLDEATGDASCLKKVDLAPPVCWGSADPSPEASEDVVDPPDVVMDSGSETMDGAAPDSAGADSAGDGSSLDSGPQADGTPSDTPWTWPDVQPASDVIEEPGGGGGGKGCAAGPPGAPVAILLLFGVILALRFVCFRE